MAPRKTKWPRGAGPCFVLETLSLPSERRLDRAAKGKGLAGFGSKRSQGRGMVFLAWGRLTKENQKLGGGGAAEENMVFLFRFRFFFLLSPKLLFPRVNFSPP